MPNIFDCFDTLVILCSTEFRASAVCGMTYYTCRDQGRPKASLSTQNA